MAYKKYLQTYKISFVNKMEDNMTVNKDTCIGCGTCVVSCPVNAITLNDGKAEINQDICIHCGTCVGVCPVNAINE